jgi:hypothetical protein
VRRVRILGLCVAAVMVLAAFVATSAFAAGPEWGQCVSKAGGSYSNANCTVKAKKGAGSYEWKKGAAGIKNRSFRGTGGTGVLDTKARVPNCNERTKECEEQYEKGEGYEAKIAVECTSENATGEVSGKDDVSNIDVVFHGCVLLGSVPCSNTTHEGEVLVNTLTGTLGYISKSEHSVGVDLTPAKKKGDFAQFACGGLETVVGEAGKAGPHEGGPVYKPKGGGDGIISPITPVNTMTHEYTQVYTVNEADENIPSKFEGKPLQVLEAYTYNAEEPRSSWLWGKAGESITNVNTAEEASEIKA